MTSALRLLDPPDCSVQDYLVPRGAKIPRVSDPARPPLPRRAPRLESFSRIPLLYPAQVHPGVETVPRPAESAVVAAAGCGRSASFPSDAPS